MAKKKGRTHEAPAKFSFWRRGEKRSRERGDFSLLRVRSSLYTRESNHQKNRLLHDGRSDDVDDDLFLTGKRISVNRRRTSIVDAPLRRE